jgi:hypothetical protein
MGRRGHLQRPRGGTASAAVRVARRLLGQRRRPQLRGLHLEPPTGAGAFGFRRDDRGSRASRSPARASSADRRASVASRSSGAAAVPVRPRRRRGSPRAARAPRGSERGARSNPPGGPRRPAPAARQPRNRDRPRRRRVLPAPASGAAAATLARGALAPDDRAAARARPRRHRPASGAERGQARTVRPKADRTNRERIREPRVQRTPAVHGVGSHVVHAHPRLAGRVEATTTVAPPCPRSDRRPVQDEQPVGGRAHHVDAQLVARRSIRSPSGKRSRRVPGGEEGAALKALSIEPRLCLAEDGAPSAPREDPGAAASPRLRELPLARFSWSSARVVRLGGAASSRLPPAGFAFLREHGHGHDQAKNTKAATFIRSPPTRISSRRRSPARQRPAHPHLDLRPDGRTASTACRSNFTIVPDTTPRARSARSR